MRLTITAITIATAVFGAGLLWQPLDWLTAKVDQQIATQVDTRLTRIEEQLAAIREASQDTKRLLDKLLTRELDRGKSK